MSTPQGPIPAIGIPDSQDYPRLIYAAPYFTQVPLAELIEPAVTEAVEAMLPSLVPPFVDQAANAAVQQLAVLLAGSTMQGPLYLSPVMPTQPSQAASMAYVDAMIATAGVPEVPATPIGQTWARQVGQWVPIAEEGGTFLPLAGGTMQGQINMSGNAIVNLAALPVMPNGAAPAQWVLNQISSVSLYQGLWDMDTYVPDLTQLSTHVNGYTWIAVTTSLDGVVIAPAIPGLQGKTVFNGDTVIFSSTAGAFQYIHAGGLSLPEAQALFLALAGGQMSGPLLLNADATSAMQAVTYQQFEAAIGGFVTPDAPGDGQAYLRIGLTHAWTPGVPISGATMTGALILSGNATNGLGAVTLNQLNATLSGNFVPIAGGTMTGPLVLSGNATQGFNPVPLSQLNAQIAGYLPLTGGAINGALTVSAAAGSGTAAQLGVGGQGISYLAQGAPGANIAFSYTAPNFNAYSGSTAIGLLTTSQAAAGYLPLVGGTLTGNLAIGNGGTLNVAGQVAADTTLTVGTWEQINGNNGSGLALNITNGGLSTNGNQGGYFAPGVNCVNGNLQVGWTTNVDAKCILGNPGVTWQLGASGSNQNFYIWEGGSTGQTRMSIDPSGNVTWLIATMAVSGAAGGGNLNISGAAQVGNQLTCSSYVSINGANPSGYGLIITNGVPLIQRTDTNNVTMLLGNAVSTWQIYKAGNADSFGIWQGGLGGGGANRMLIDTNGSVTFSGFLTIGSTFYCYHIQPQNNGVVNCGQIAEAWSNVYSYNFPAPSDPSLKNEVVAPPDGALALVQACPTVQFKWRPEAGAGLDPNRLHRGFLTTDVEKYVDAELVVKDPEGKGPDCLHLNEMIAVLWQAVQELAAQVKALTPATA